RHPYASCSVIKLAACRLDGLFLHLHQFDMRCMSTLKKLHFAGGEPRAAELFHDRRGRRLAAAVVEFGSACLVAFKKLRLLRRDKRHDITGQGLRKVLVLRCEPRTLIAALLYFL